MILKRFNMQNSKKGFLLMQHVIKFSKTQCPSSSDEYDWMSQASYASPIGSIMYVVTCTWIDVSYALSMVSHFYDNPGDSH